MTIKNNLVKTFLTSITFDSLSRKIKNPCLVINFNFNQRRNSMKNSKNKFLIAALSFMLLFSVSCKNEDKTGGGTGNYGSNTKTNNYVPTPNPDPTPTPPPVIPGQLTASATSDIKIIVTDNGMHSAGSIAFEVNPPELKNTGDLTVSIESVNTNRLNESFLQFKPEDFNSLTPISTELTLSESGLKKTNQIMNSGSISSLIYSYDVTFKFTTTSDTVSNKTATAKSTVRLYKYKLVTAQMLEDMIKTTPKLTVSNRYQSIYDNYEDSFDIDFSKLTYTAGLKTISINNANGTMTLPAKETSTFSKYLCGFDSINFGTDENSKFLYTRRSLGTTTVSADGKTLTANYKFPLKREYIWDNNMTFATNEGLNIEFRLDKGKWIDGF